MLYLFLILGLALLLAGANFLVDSSVAIAKKAKISDFVIGLTIVGMGTSAPELFVSISAALQGMGDMAIGNVIGSNICNIMLILGVTALITPFGVNRANLRRDIPITALASIVLALLSFDTLFGGKTNVISCGEGVAMLVAFIAFMIYSFRRPQDSTDDEEPANPGLMSRLNYPILIVIALASLAALIYGGNMFLDSTVQLARILGMSDSVISITIVAVGTSLPELVTCVIAALKGNSQLALGNALGSNIFNILLVLGAAAAISPLALVGVDIVDYSLMIVSALMLVLFSFTLRHNVIDRWEGAIFVAGYIGYMAYLLLK